MNALLSSILRFICALSICLSQLRSAPAAAADLKIPFVIHGLISTEEFHPSREAQLTEANFAFYSSNGWWEIQITHPNAKDFHPRLQSCMKIPDGTREFILFEGTKDGVLNTAHASPTLHPTHSAMIALWLGFCPHAELPILDESRTRRFLNLPVPNSELTFNPRNQGRYTARYSDDSKTFISDLIIFNNGYEVGIGPDNNNLIQPFRAPFDQGFKETEFHVQRWTNVNGFRFPSKAQFSHFWPGYVPGKPAPASTNDLMMTVRYEFQVTGIEFPKEPFGDRMPAPEKVFAMDTRPPGLPAGRTVDYLVNKDQWKPLSDPELVHRARMAREQ